MLVRDLLVALPGLLGPLGSAPRTNELDVAQQGYTTADSLASPLQTALLSGTTVRDADENPFQRAQATTGSSLADFYQAQKIDFSNPAAPEDDTPLPPQDGDGGSPDTDTPETRADLHLDLTAEAGRVLTVTPPVGDDIDSIRILSQTGHGHVSVNPDHSLALVLSEDPAETAATDFSYEITYRDGSIQTVTTDVTVTAGRQENGWSLGEAYMLAEGSDGTLVIEHGENHRKLYVTGNDDGLTKADIARAEGVSEASVTAAWLAKHPEYGATPDKALAPDIGMALWQYITPSSGSHPATSNWLLFERGYDYPDVSRLVTRGSSGESALHPVFIGAYGEGSDPVVGGAIQISLDPSANIVIQGIDARGLLTLGAKNILFDDISLYGSGGSIQNSSDITIRNSDFIDIVRDAPVDGSDYWDPHTNRTGGIFVATTDGLLIENNVFDHNGWADGYDYNLSGSSPMPPSMFSQNVYLNYDNSDVTFRDNISMRAASFGAQIRSGGFIENNSFIDNNAAINFLGGNSYGEGAIGNYTLLLDNLVTSAGHKRVAALEGALSMGIDNAGLQSSLIGNIVAHLADPANPTEIAQKSINHDALKTGSTPFYDDTIVYDWATTPVGEQRNPDTNIDGLDTAVLDQTTIQNFTAELLGKDSATIADLGDYLRAQADGKLDHVVDADLINAWFREGFGLATTLRADEATLRFVPDDRGEGMRWDNRLNWSTDDLPGTQDGDSVDLGGNRVLFGAKTVTVDDFIFGDHGQLKATSGRLDIDGGVSVGDHGGLLEIGNAGQVWMAGYLDSDMLAIEVGGGRFANKGAFAGAVDLDLSGDGQALLAVAGSSFDLQDGSSISVAGSKARAGFDGGDGGSAVLRLHDGASLSFAADQTGFGSLSEFYSGAYEASNVTSGIRLDGDLAIDLSGWTAAPEAQKWVLAKADQLIGSFDGLDIAGLDSDRDALVRVDYVADTVTLILSADGAGSGRVRMVEAGEADFIDYTKDAALTALWTALHQDAPAVSDVPF